VLGDISDPQLAGPLAGEPAADQIIGGDHAADPPGPGRAGQPVDPGLAHHNGHQVLADLDLPAHGQLGMHPARSVGAAGGQMDLADQPGQPLAAHLGSPTPGGPGTRSSPGC